MGNIAEKNKQLRFIAISSVMAQLLLFLGVRTGIYTHGFYSASRHSLAVLPILLIGICVSAYSLFQIGQDYIKEKNPKLVQAGIASILILLLCINYNNWRTIRRNWTKEDVRSAVNLWLDETGGTEDIYLYYAAVPAFSIYAAERNLDYGKEAIRSWGIFGTGADPNVTQYKNFHYGEPLRDKDVEYMKNSINQSFSNRMPDSFWFLLSHIYPDNQTYMEAFAEMGYGYQIYRWNDARLLWLCNSSYIDRNYKRLIKENISIENLVMGTDQLMYSAENNHYYVDGNDPKFFITVPDIIYTPNQKHKAVVDFTSTHAGSVQIFFTTVDSSDFNENDSVTAQYVAGSNKVMAVLPENAKLDSLRLDFDNTGVDEGQENSIRLLGFNILEEIAKEH